MHFRKRGSTIRVIRTSYDKKTKKAVSTSLGSLSLNSEVIPDDLKAQCTPEEVKEVQVWMGSARKVERLNAEHAARSLPQVVADAIAWFKTDTGDDVEQVATQALAAMSQLRRTLKNKNLLG